MFREKCALFFCSADTKIKLKIFSCPLCVLLRKTIETKRNDRRDASSLYPGFSPPCAIPGILYIILLPRFLFMFPKYVRTYCLTAHSSRPRGLSLSPRGYAFGEITHNAHLQIVPGIQLTIFCKLNLINVNQQAITRGTSINMHACLKKVFLPRRLTYRSIFCSTTVHR